MKKKILLALVLTVVFTCLFVIGVSATTIYKDANGTELFRYETFATSDEVSAHFGFAYDDAIGVIKSYTGSFPKTNADGKELTWYVTATATDGDDTVITVASGTTVGDVGTVNDAGVYTFNKGYSKDKIVSANFPDNAGIKTFGFGSYGSYSSTFPKANYNLLFVYCPNTLTEFGFNFVQSMPVLVCEIDDETPVTAIPQNFAHDARNLREINIPVTVEIINGDSSSKGAAFYRNVMLQNVTFASDDNLKTMKNYCFADCISLTQVKIPNSVTQIGGQCFQTCKKLEKIWLGASLEKTTSISVFRLCNNLKVYYVPSTLTTVNQHTFTHDSGAGPSDTVFFYAGTRAQFDVFYQAAVAGGKNERVTNGYKEAYIVEWDPTKPDSYYTNLATTEGHKLYVINYNVCDAFYGSKHNITVAEGNECCGICSQCEQKQMLPENEQTHHNAWIFNGGEAVNFTVAFTAEHKCVWCGTPDGETETIGAIFTSNGISYIEDAKEVANYGPGVYEQIKIDTTSLEKYAQYSGQEFDYGIFACTATEDEGTPISKGEDGKGTADEKTVFASFTGTEYTYLRIKITGLENGASLYTGAYLILGDNVSYFSNGKAGNAVAKFTAVIPQA